MTESYADAPPSITELRSDRTGKAEDWTPRDALIATLREIDNGEFTPDQIIIVWASPVKNDGKVDTGSRLAGKYSTLESAGLLAKALERQVNDR